MTVRILTGDCRDILTDDEKVERFPTAAQLKRAVDAATPLAPALPPGREHGQATRYVRQVFDLDADDYVPLADPIPDTDTERYQEAIKASRERVREAGRRDREREAGVAA